MTAVEHPLSPEELMEYLDGELPIARASVVQAHVLGCDGCQRLSVELRGVSRDMARWQVEDAPETLTAPQPSPGAVGNGSLFGWLRLRPSIAYGIAAVLVGGVVAMAGNFMSRYSQSSVSRPAIVQARDVPSVPKADVASVPKATTYSDRRTEGVAGNARPVVPVVPGIAAGQVRLGPQAPATAPAAPQPSIARTARLRVRTTDFDAARPVVDRVVTDTGGFVGRVDVSGARGEARSLTATLHIPATRLDAAIASLKAIGVVIDESQSGDDVTEQIVDVEARLSNARNTEKRLVDLLQKRTGDLADVLAAEREIARVRVEIEQLDGQRKNLARRVTYATLTLEVTEQRQAELDLGPQPVSAMFRDAFVAGLSGAVDSALGLCLFVVRVGPILLLWIAVLVWPVRAVVRWSRRPANP